MLHKNFRVIVTKSDERTGLVDMLIPMSTASMDRSDEIIESGAWKDTLPLFMKRPILLSSHQANDLRKQIGEFEKLEVTNNGLYGQPRYYINDGNPEADWAFKLASRGMAAYSVGFIPLDFEDGRNGGPSRIYKKVELLEISQVVIPANRDAIQCVRAGTDSPVIKSLCNDVLASYDDPINRAKKEFIQAFEELQCNQFAGALDNSANRFKEEMRKGAK